MKTSDEIDGPPRGGVPSPKIFGAFGADGQMWRVQNTSGVILNDSRRRRRFFAFETLNVRFLKGKR